MEIFLHPVVLLDRFLSTHQVPTVAYEITTLSLNITYNCSASDSGLLLASSHKLAHLHCSVYSHTAVALPLFWHLSP